MVSHWKHTYACNYWLQVGALNTTSTVSFGRLPDPSRNSSFPDTHSLSGLPYLLSSAGLLCSPPSFFFKLIVIRFFIFGVCSFVPPSFGTLMSFTVPAHGLGSLSDDEGGASGAVHRLAGKRDWMLRTGFVRSDSCGGILTVWRTCAQALEQTKLGSAHRDRKLFCFFKLFGVNGSCCLYLYTDN